MFKVKDMNGLISKKSFNKNSYLLTILVENHDYGEKIIENITGWCKSCEKYGMNWDCIEKPTSTTEIVVSLDTAELWDYFMACIFSNICKYKADYTVSPKGHIICFY